MKSCKKCNIELDVSSNKCPLCNSEIKEVKNFVSSYPVINTIINKNIFRKVMIFIACIASLIVLVVNYLLTPKITWAPFVVLQIVLSAHAFTNILSGRKKIIKFLLFLNILVSAISVFWDVYTNFHGWSVNYVLPSLCISYGLFMLILRLVNYYAFRENSNYIYLNICLEFVPLILVLCDKATPNILIYLSTIFGVLNLLILLIFDGSSLKDDIIKKLHI